MKREKRIPEFATEAILCDAFMVYMKQHGYTCYPETGGFDILLVDKDHVQTGIQAKLSLNPKVIQQIIPAIYDDHDIGPHHRAILVPTFDNVAFHWLATIGVGIYRHSGCGTFTLGDGHGRDDFLFDWNPSKLIELPEFLPDCRAGMPSPSPLTKWKISALRVLAHLEIHGSIERKQFRRYGVDYRLFVHNVKEWVVPVREECGGIGGRYARGPGLPSWDQAHPTVYPQILEQVRQSVVTP